MCLAKEMVVDKGKKQKVEDENYIDEKLIFSIEKLQEIQDELEKVKILSFPISFYYCSLCLYVNL